MTGHHGGHKAMLAAMVRVCLCYLAYTYLIVFQMSADAKTNQHPTTVQPLISINTCRMRMFEILILCACIGGIRMRHTKW
jgi:hypothetical protein